MLSASRPSIWFWGFLTVVVFVLVENGALLYYNSQGTPPLSSLDPGIVWKGSPVSAYDSVPEMRATIDIELGFHPAGVVIWRWKPAQTTRRQGHDE